MSEELEKAEETTIPEEGVVEESAEEQVIEEEDSSLAEETERKRLEEHKEKSKIGRRMSAMEETMNNFIEQATQTLSAGKKDPTDELDKSDYLTVGAFEQMMQKQANEASKQSDERTRADMLYGRGYEKELLNIADTVDDESLHLEVMKLVTDTKDLAYSSRSSKDPAAAAQINYNKALRSLSKIVRKPNLKGDKKLPASASPSKNKTRNEPDIELSNEALEYCKRTGTSIEDAKKLLSKV